MIKRITGLLLSLIMCIGCLVPALAADGPVSSYSSAYLVANAYTGDILFSQNADIQYEPASCTKILTALLVIEACEKGTLSMDKEVTVSHDAVWSIDRGSSHIALQEGEVVTIRQLMYGLLVASANDCAVALAEAVSGTVVDFAALMNKRAAELGAKNTHFVNPHGLHDEGHLTTAEDLALIMKACLQKQDFVKIQSSNYYAVGPTNKSKQPHTFSSVYRMIKGGWYFDDRIVCGKSGYTKEAGNSLVNYAYADGMGLIIVTMHSSSEKNAYKDVEKLMDYTYKNYHVQKLTLPESVDMDTPIGKFTAAPVQRSYTVFTGSNGDISAQSETDGFVIVNKEVLAENLKSSAVMTTEQAEVKTGDVIGSLDFYSGQTKVASKTLMATSDCAVPEEITPQKSFLSTVGGFLWGVVKGAFVVFFVLLVLVLCIRTYNINKRKKRRKARLEQMQKQRRK